MPENEVTWIRVETAQHIEGRGQTTTRLVRASKIDEIGLIDGDVVIRLEFETEWLVAHEGSRETLKEFADLFAGLDVGNQA